MHHFDFLATETLERLFHNRPKVIDRTSGRESLAHALGATLYVPASRPDLAKDLAGMRRRGAISVVLCLEDAIADVDVIQAEAHLVEALRSLEHAAVKLPLVFVRVRSTDQPERLASRLGTAAQLLDGFVLPKFSSVNARAYLDAVAACEQMLARRLWVMPVIETSAVIHVESRRDELLALRAVLLEVADRVLAVRIGATDLAGLYALRRPRDVTIHDVRVVSDVIADVVNVLGRPNDGLLVTGPVWEYFAAPARIFKPQLRATPFVARDDAELRDQLLALDLDGLIREVVLDHANGLVGKSVIHPTHLAVVHALSVVPHEEYLDAVEILDMHGSGGAARSTYRNKMNEAGPHQWWARRAMYRAEAFGVAAPGVTFIDLMGSVSMEVGL